MFGVAVVAKQHDPIARLPEVVCMRRVWEQRRVMALMARRVQDREPSFARRIESARCDFLYTSRPCSRNVANRTRDARSDPFDFLESFHSIFIENISYRMGQTAEDVGGIAVRPNAKPVRILFGKNLRNLIKPTRDLEIWTLFQRSLR